MKMTRYILTVLMAGYICISPAAAQDSDYVTRLNKANIEQFLETMRKMSVDQSLQYMQDDIIAYFDKHLPAGGKYFSQTTFELPGMPVKSTEIDLTKDEFIANVIDGQGLLKNYTATVNLKNVDISGSGKSARIQSVITEKGKLPWPDGQGNKKLVPVEGVSECAQLLRISLTNYIELAKAECKTTISFLPFGDTPLGQPDPF